MISQDAIEREIMRLSERLEAECVQFAGLAETAGIAEATYKAAHAKRSLAEQANVTKWSASLGDKVADADDEIAGLLLERKISEARAEASREAMRTMRTQIDALRTLAANQRGLGT